MVALLFIGCQNKSPEQLAKESVERQEAKWKEKAHYRDSLAYIAFGYKDKDDYDTRMDALTKLRQEYPDYNKSWDKVRDAIVYREVFTDTITKE